MKQNLHGKVFMYFKISTYAKVLRQHFELFISKTVHDFAYEVVVMGAWNLFLILFAFC